MANLAAFTFVFFHPGPDVCRKHLQQLLQDDCLSHLVFAPLLGLHSVP